MNYNVIFTAQPVGNWPIRSDPILTAVEDSSVNLSWLQYIPVSTFHDKDVAVFVNAKKKKKNSLLAY